MQKKQTKGKITDFCSYYHLPSTVFKCEKHANLGAVYSYYNVATSISYTELVNDALVLARLSGTYSKYSYSMKFFDLIRVQMVLFFIFVRVFVIRMYVLCV